MRKKARLLPAAIRVLLSGESATVSPLIGVAWRLVATMEASRNAKVRMRFLFSWQVVEVEKDTSEKK